MTSRVFVTGTDTEVGKTIVARAITRAAARRGLKVRAIKPVESGAPIVDGRPSPLDARALAEAAEGPGAEPAFAYGLRDPVSPHLAAARDGVEIEPAPILALLEDAERGADVVIAEGAGGLMVPLSRTLLFADVIARTGYRLVIVAPNVLGTINATLLTIEAARARRIPLAGVILNGTPATDLGNADAIFSFGKTRILGEMPTAKELDDESLADLAEAHLDLDQLFKH